MKVLILFSVCFYLAWGYPMQIKEELGDDFEGDMIISNTRSALKDTFYHWPNAEVPYEFDKNFSSEEKWNVQEAMRVLHRDTCVRFRLKTKDDKDYVHISKKRVLCASEVGRQNGMQYLYLGENCIFSQGTVVHELMHTLGFIHEHSRPERDDFVTIYFDNIKYGKEGNFDKMHFDSVNNFTVGYDYGSIMHYASNAFSKNGFNTIVAKDPDAEIGQRRQLSKKDIEKVNKLYCNKV